MGARGVRAINVVGAGLAGLSAALVLARDGVPCRLISAQASERAQSVLAEGGINAALDVMGEHDTVQEHFAETMCGGVWLADPNAVWGLVQDAPGIVRELEALGVPFQREGGKMVQRNFGGQKKKRTAYAKSSTGKVLVTAMVDAVRQQEARGLVSRHPHAELADIKVADGSCQGVWVRDVYTGSVAYHDGPTILACGGMGAMFGGLTTGTTTNTGNVAALAFLRGAELANLEFLQYHPTTVPIAGKRMLVSEAARGEGGRLFALRGGEPWYFMEERYPELGNLMPRDVVSREEYRVLRDPRCDGHVYLDMRGLSKRIWRERLSDLREEVEHYLAIDPAKQPVPVEPGIHYFMGGIHVDERHQTNVRDLYAAGECACAYHGANRLGGNSLLGAIRGGKVAARSAMEDVEAAMSCQRHIDGACVQGAAYAGEVHFLSAGSASVEASVSQVLGSCMGIIRSRDGLQAGIDELDALPQMGRVQLARAIVASALAREESRGAHQRADFPKTRDEFRRTTVASWDGHDPQIRFEELPEPREGVPRL